VNLFVIEQFDKKGFFSAKSNFFGNKNCQKALLRTFLITATQLFIVLCRVEDHDDLTPIFNRQSDVLTSTYGMLYVKMMKKLVLV